jgi:hypothetical protein
MGSQAWAAAGESGGLKCGIVGSTSPRIKSKCQYLKDMSRERNWAASRGRGRKKTIGSNRPIIMLNMRMNEIKKSMAEERTTESANEKSSVLASANPGASFGDCRRLILE